MKKKKNSYVEETKIGKKKEKRRQGRRKGRDKDREENKRWRRLGGCDKEEKRCKRRQGRWKLVVCHPDQQATSVVA